MKRLLIAILIVFFASGSLNGARKALVIGNAAYSGKQALNNPLNDAADISSALEELGFSVTSLQNLSLRGLKEGIDAFTLNLSPVDEVLFYYSGHGAQASGENYLIPIGASIKTPADYAWEAVSASWALQRMAVARLTIFVLDACRNDPTTKSFGVKGLAKLEPENGSQYVIYATEKDAEALDGASRNSPFAESFVRNLRSSPKKIEDMMKDVRAEVRRATSNQQNPTAYGILDMDFYFNSSASPAVTEAKPVTPTAPKPQIETVWLYGNLEVETNLAGDLYINGDKIQSLAAGQKAKISKLVTGDYTVELRTTDGNKSQQVSVQKDQTQSLAFKFEKKVQAAVTTPAATPSAQPSTLTPTGMVYVEGGSFNMGSNDGYDDEKPVHQVSVSSFYIGKYEVSQKEWRDVMGSSPSYFKGDDKPVEYVSWYDVIEYCNQRSLKEGLTPCYSGSGSSITCNWQANGYRLPTEAEWEYAARGGIKSKGYTYSGSNDLGSVAWYYVNSSDKGENHPDYGTHKAGTKAANELGIYDMSGNVWEWCWDWYDSGYYGKSQSSDPIGAGSGSYRVVRGGSWDFNPVYLRVCNRINYYPIIRNSSIGVRLVRAK